MIPALVLAALMVLSLAPAVLWSPHDQFGGGTADVVVAIARMMGRCGVVLLMWQFVLGFRRVVRTVTPDLLASNRVHRWLGIGGIVLVVAHPLLLLFASSESAMAFFAPHLRDNADVVVTLGKVALALLALTWIGSAVFRQRLGFRQWRRLHVVNYVVLPMVLGHSFNGSSFADPSLRRYWIVLTIGATGLVIARALDAAGVGQPQYRVASIEDVARGTRRLALMPIARGLRPAPGQFVYVQMRRFGEAHPFTSSHFDEASGELSITAKGLGPFSKRLHTLRSGDSLWVSGPFGVFTREAATTLRPIVLIAGGIGITPFVRLLRERRDHLDLTPLTLIYANRTPRDAAYRDEVDEIAAVNRYVKVVHVFNEEPADLPVRSGVSIASGVVSEQLIRTYLRHAAEVGEFFLCGPPPMMDAVIGVLRRLGVPAAQIHSERFSF